MATLATVAAAAGMAERHAAAAAAQGGIAAPGGKAGIVVRHQERPVVLVRLVAVLVEEASVQPSRRIVASLDFITPQFLAVAVALVCMEKVRQALALQTKTNRAAADLAAAAQTIAKTGANTAAAAAMVKQYTRRVAQFAPELTGAKAESERSVLSGLAGLAVRLHSHQPTLVLNYRKNVLLI